MLKLFQISVRVCNSDNILRVLIFAAPNVETRVIAKQRVLLDIARNVATFTVIFSGEIYAINHPHLKLYPEK